MNIATHTAGVARAANRDSPSRLICENLDCMLKILLSSAQSNPKFRRLGLRNEDEKGIVSNGMAIGCYK